MTKQIVTALSAAGLVVLAACGAPKDWQANGAQADTSTSRVPNPFGSGN